MAEKQRSLIVVADREIAKFFLHARPGATLDVHGPEVSHPSEGDTTADRPGRAFDSHGEGRHAMQPPTSYQDAERQSMGHDIAERVTAAFNEHEVDRLVLVADPKLLGEIRNTLAKPIRDHVVLEITSHLTQATANDLARRLDKDGTLGPVRESKGRPA